MIPAAPFVPVLVDPQAFLVQQVEDRLGERCIILVRFDPGTPPPSRAVKLMDEPHGGENALGPRIIRQLARVAQRDWPHAGLLAGGDELDIIGEKRSCTSPSEYFHSHSYWTVQKDNMGRGLKLVMCGKTIGSMPRSFIMRKVRLAKSTAQIPAAGTMVPSARL